MIEKARLNNSFGYFGDDRKIGNWMVVGEIFFIERGFFSQVVLVGMGRCLLKEKG